MDKLFEDLIVIELRPDNISAVIGMLLADFGAQVVTVSYTHLTLPTNREV